MQKEPNVQTFQRSLYMSDVTGFNRKNNSEMEIYNAHMIHGTGIFAYIHSP